MKVRVAFTTVLVLFGLAPSLFAGISLRAGVALPQGDFKDYAGTGWSIGVVADLQPFSVPFLSIPVLINYTGYGKEEVKWMAADDPEIFTQESQVTMTGGGVGLKLEPPALPLKPFVEVLGRLASIEQEYHSGKADELPLIESKTKFGVQLTGGIKYPLVPTVSAQLGVSYTTYFGAEMQLAGKERKFDAGSLGLFVGTTFDLSW